MERVTQHPPPYGLPHRLRLNDWELQMTRMKVGKGQFADVVTAQHGERTKKRCAAKRSLLAFGDESWDEKMVPAELERQRLLVVRELEMMQTTHSHPRLTNLLGFTMTDEGRIDRVVTELAAGSLRDFLHVRRPQVRKLRHAELVRVLRHAAVGMAHLHSISCVHGNLTTGNILVFLPERSGEVGTADAKLCDFGVPHCERIRNLEFTPISPYQAPETIGDTGDKHEAPADVFSFGVSCVETGSGRPPGLGQKLGEDTNPEKSVKTDKLECYRRGGDLAAIQPPLTGLGGIARPCLQDVIAQRPFATRLVDQLSDVEAQLRGDEGLRIASDVGGLTRLAQRLEEADEESRGAIRAEMQEARKQQGKAEDEKKEADNKRAAEWLARKAAEGEVTRLKMELDKSKKEIMRQQNLRQQQGRFPGGGSSPYVPQAGSSPAKNAARVMAAGTSGSPRGDRGRGGNDAASVASGTTTTSRGGTHKKPKVGVATVRMAATEGIGDYSAPRAGLYKFTCVGAAGGGANNGLQKGGSGAVAQATFRLEDEHLLFLCVGSKGGDGNTGCGGGGGGATFVANEDGEPWVVAGGAGGAGLGGASVRAWTKEDADKGGGELAGGGEGGTVLGGCKGGAAGGAHVGGGGGAGWNGDGGGLRRAGVMLCPVRGPDLPSEGPGGPIMAGDGGKSRGHAGPGGYGGGGAGAGPGGGGGGGYCGGGGSRGGAGGCGGSFIVAHADAPQLKRGTGESDGQMMIEFMGD